MNSGWKWMRKLYSFWIALQMGLLNGFWVISEARGVFNKVFLDKMQQIWYCILIQGGSNKENFPFYKFLQFSMLSLHTMTVQFFKWTSCLNNAITKHSNLNSIQITHFQEAFDISSFPRKFQAHGKLKFKLVV